MLWLRLLDDYFGPRHEPRPHFVLFSRLPHFFFSHLSCCGSNFLSTSRRPCSRLLRQRLKRSCTSFEIFGTWFLASSATRRRDFGAAVREGLLVGDRWFPGATILGAPNHPVSVPPTGPELCGALLCGLCTRWHALTVQTGSLSWCWVFSVDVAASQWPAVAAAAVRVSRCGVHG